MTTTDAVFTAGSGSRRADRLGLFAQPVAVLVIVGAVLVWALTSNLDDVEKQTLNGPSLLRATWDHVVLTFVVTALVVVIAIPLGILLTRRWARMLAPVFLAIANIGQAAPAIGVMVLFFLWSAWEG